MPFLKKGRAYSARPSVIMTDQVFAVDQADCVFDRFSKLDEFKQGTGLGLNICSIIAGRLKGEVKLD